MSFQLPLGAGSFAYMAKSRTDTESVLKLVIDGQQAKASVKELGDTYRKLTTEINNMKKADNPKAYQEKVQQIQKVERAWREAREEIRGATRDSLDFKKAIPDIAKSAIGKLSVAGGVYALSNGIRTLVQRNAELSDAMAGVMKTTGLSEEAVDRLNEKFKQIDTRTPILHLNELAQVAGKLGYSAEKDVLGFVSAADKIGVALGEDLGGVEEAVNSLGKLINIFKINDQFELEESLLKVGSAINTLGASGTANEKNLIDFAQRLAGVAPAANISLPPILAIGAVMDELGQSMERSSTAIGQFLVQIGSDVPTYAKVAKMSVKEFSDLLNRDAVEAFLRVLNGAKTTKGGLEGLAEAMGILDVTGSGGVAALGALAENVELVREKIKTAQQAFDEGTSVLEEFNTVNTNLAANLEKIWNKINILWYNSEFRKWLTDITGAIIDNRSEIEKITDAYNQKKKALKETEEKLAPLLIRYEELKGKTTRSKKEQEDLNRTIQQISLIMPEAISEWDKYGRIMDINRKKVEDLTKAQRDLLAAQNKQTLQDLNKEFEKLVLRAGAWQHHATTATKLLVSGRTQDDKPLTEQQRTTLASEYNRFNEQRIQDMGKAYEAAVAFKEAGGKITPAMEKIINYFEGQKSGTAGNTTNKETNTGGVISLSKDAKKKAEQEKKERERQQHQAKEHFERLLKEERLFSANQLINQKARHEKELEQVKLNYDKQIAEWEDFKKKRGGATAEQIAEADEKIAKLTADKEKAVQDLRLKQEKELLESIHRLREELGHKYQTELDKERDLINSHYDKLKEDFAGNEETLKQIEEARAKDLADAKLRAEESLYEEIKQIREENYLLGLTEDQKRLMQIDIQYNAELEKLREKYNAELQETELFQQAKEALEEKYRLRKEEIEKEYEVKRRDDLRNAAIETAQIIADATFSIISNNIQAESNARIAELERQRDRELSNKNLTEKQKAAIQEKYDKKIRAEKLRAWKAQKKADILSAVINTALAVTRALPNFILAAAAGAAGAAQIAVISAQKTPQFEKGGFIPKGASHSQGGINLIDSKTRNFVGQVEGGEPILSRKTYANNREIVDALLYSSQRQNGARIRLHPGLIEAEQGVRNQRISIPTPVVNVDVPQPDNREMLELLRKLANKEEKPQRVVLSTRLLEDYNKKKVDLENRVNG